MLYRRIYSIFFFLFIIVSYGQNEKAFVIKNDSIIAKDKKRLVSFDQGIDPLSPSRAAFYSAVLPGLGQLYNKKYWKVPIVWGAIGTGIYFFDRNDKQFKRYQSAYKLELAGRPHEFDGLDGNPRFDRAALERAQNVFKKNRDVSLFVTIGLYALNILEANVDAHLPDKALDTNLSFHPTFFTESVTNQPMFGVTMNFKF